MAKLKVLDLFSGIGGFSLGLERTGGFETVAFCEIEEFPRKVLAKHWPEVPIYHDVRELTGEQVGPVDVICGGFPCQDISTSGTGKGLDGERSGLWREFARLIGQVRPTFVIVENSPNLVTGGNGRWMGRVLSDLSAIRYDAEWHVVPLSDTGAPHRRERVWIIAYAAGVRQSGQGQLLNEISAAPDAYREADRFVDAFRQNALPFVCRRHDGVSARLAEPRLKAFGNAVGPVMAENLGRAILEAAE